MRRCSECGTTETKKWYVFGDGYLCQKHYRAMRYQARRSEICEYERKKYRAERHKRKVCHQKIIRDKHHKGDVVKLGRWAKDTDINKYVLDVEQYCDEHRLFIEKYEWLGNVGNIPKWVFTARYNGHLAGVVMLNEPNSYSKLIEFAPQNVECLIQRGACASWGHKHLASKLIMFGLRWMVKNTHKRVFVAYSDPMAGEIGAIYQACNFEYLGRKYGCKTQYKHPTFNSGRPFTEHTLRRTNNLKKFVRSIGVPWRKEWQNDKGFKDLKVLPEDIKKAWYQWGKEIIGESKATALPPKGKYVMVLGADKREQKLLDSHKLYKPKKYEKRR